jgi:hypothetical protein
MQRRKTIGSVGLPLLSVNLRGYVGGLPLCKSLQQLTATLPRGRGKRTGNPLVRANPEIQERQLQ